MKINTNLIMIIFATLLIFGGCSKDVEEYNKPAVYWYSKIVSSIADGDLEKADSYYSSLQGEHIGSPLLPEATMILSIAHMYYEEYILSEHFADEYIKRYANANEREFAEFMKIKAKYMALPNPRRDQVLIQEAIKEGERFKLNYPRSMYFVVADTMLTNLKMAEAALNENIANLYVRLDKPKSAEYYRSIKAQPWMNWEEIDRASSPWYREIFEGDGTQSWYAFMIPDTQSVVSRNTVSQESSLEDAFIDADNDGMPKEGMDQIINAATKKETIPKPVVDEKPKVVTSMQEYEIKRTKELVEKGVLTQEEFEEIRDEILQGK